MNMDEHEELNLIKPDELEQVDCSMETEEKNDRNRKFTLWYIVILFGLASLILTVLKLWKKT